MSRTVIKLDKRTVNEASINWQLLSRCDLTGIEEWHGYDATRDKVITKTCYPAEHTKLLLQSNNEQAIEADRRKYGELTKVASIPPNVWQEQLGEANQNHDTKWLQRWLNDPDNAKFRTKSGTV